MNKTLGQMAFWRFHYERGDITAEQVEALWEGIPLSERDAWEAAALAVAAAILVRCPLCGESSKSLGIISQDSLPPMLTHLLQCVDGHQWSIGWEGL
jgi:hypothetical protein